MKKICLSISCALFSVLANAENTLPASPTTTQSVANSINVVSRPQIIGLWGMQLENNKQCVEYYNFRADNELIVKSAAEWSVGHYQYHAPNSRAEVLPLLVMQIRYDNNEKDCAGIKEDQTGQVQQFFVKWINAQQIEFCGTEKGQQCFAILNKKLP